MSPLDCEHNSLVNLPNYRNSPRYHEIGMAALNEGCMRFTTAANCRVPTNYGDPEARQISSSAVFSK
jgi:hypothetical protein